MKRMWLVLALFGAVAMAGSVTAQGPGGPGGFGKKKGPPSAYGKDSIQRIEGELAQIHRQLNRIEALLEKSGGGAKKGGWAKGGEKKGFGRPGFDRKGAAWGKKGWDKKRFGGAWAYGKKDGGEKKGFGPPGFGKKGGGDKKGFGPPGFGKKDGGEKKAFGPPGFGKKGEKGFEKKKDFEKKKAFTPPSGSGGSSSIEQRLEQLQREIGELRRVLKKQ